MFQEQVRIEAFRLTVRLGGVEPLPKEVTDQFEQLVAEQGLDTRFIGLSGQEGLFSIRDVAKGSQQRLPIGPGNPVKLTIPAKSAMVLSDDPLHQMLVGTGVPTPTPTGGEVERQVVLEFSDGDAFLALADHRTLLSVGVWCLMRVISRDQVEADSYRYSSTTGVIEVAAHTVALAGEKIGIFQHRRVPPPKV